MWKGNYMVDDLTIKLSVIIPVYNVEKFLKAGVDSLLQQINRNVELIVVDDGSTDDSGKIMRSIAYNDKLQRIKYFRKVNGGLSAARNYGLKYATGEYVFYFDSDDTVDEHFINIIQNAIDAEKADMYLFNHNLIDEQSVTLQSDVAKLPPSGLYEKAEILDRYLNDDLSSYAWQFVIRKSIAEKIFFPENRLFEDIATFYNFLLHSDMVEVINHGLYNYRIRSGSILNSSISERWIDDFIWATESAYKDIVKIDVSSSNKWYVNKLYEVARAIHRRGLQQTYKFQYQGSLKKILQLKRYVIKALGLKKTAILMYMMIKGLRE